MKRGGLEFIFTLVFLILLIIIFLIFIRAANSDSTSTSEWRMFHGYRNHTGYYPDDVNIQNMNLLWNYSTGGEVSSSPVVANGVLYVGSDDSKFYALNATNGSKVWSTTFTQNTRSAAVAGDIVYVGSLNNNLYALNATNGSIIWNYTTGGDIFMSPTVSNDIVYVSCDDFQIYALNATNGSWIWNYSIGTFVRTSPAVVNDIVYFGSHDNQIYALNATNGSWIWNYTTGDDVVSSPAIADGVVYVGSKDDQVYALNATNGSWIWNYNAGGDIYSSPAIAKGVVYIGSRANKLHALNATNGSLIWNFATTNVIDSAPVVNDQFVFVGCSNYKFYILNATNGSAMWNYTIPISQSIKSSPAIANGVIYTTAGAQIYAFTALETPVVSLTLPQNASSYITTNNVSFNCSAKDNFELVNITLYLWNSTDRYNVSTSEVTGWSNSTNWDLTNISDGSYKWNCYACDNSSNCAFASRNNTVAVLFGTEAPDPPTLSTPCNKVFQNTNSALLTYFVTDPDGDAMTCRVYGSTSPENSTEYSPITLVNTSSGNLNGSYVTYNWTSLIDGVYFWKAGCTDESLANLVGQNSSVCSFIVDTTPPNITIDFPLNVSYSSIIEFVNVTIRDRYKVYNITYSLDGGPNVSLNKVNNDWPVYGQNSLHTGVSLSKEAPTTSTVLWKANKTGTWDIFSSPTVANGIVYVGGKNNTANPGWPYVFAIEADTGKEVWSFFTGDVDDAPTIWNDRVYVTSWDIKINKTWCLNATTGEHIWNFSTPDKASGAVAIEKGMAYFYSYGTPDVFAVNATTGEHIWNRSLGATVESSPTVWNDMLFVSISKSGENLYALNATNGSTIWANTDANRYWDTSPTIVNGIIYIGSKDDYETLYAFNATNGIKIWNISFSDAESRNYLSTPAVHKGVVFGGGQSGYLHAVNATSGEGIWNSSYLGQIYSSPAIAKGMVYAGSMSLKFFAFNESDGSIIWQKSLGEIYSSPSIVDGIGYIAADDWYLYAFGTEMYYEYNQNVSISTGSHNITIYATDRAGNTNSTTLSFTITDITPPEINITYPINNSNFSLIKTIDINYTRSDDFALDSCWYSNDSYSVNTSLGTACNNITDVVWSYAQHNVIVWANDTSGNVNYSRVTFTITCTESWSCTAWSSCSGGEQTRTCTDANACGTTASKPVETQSCTSGSSPSTTHTESIPTIPPNQPIEIIITNPNLEVTSIIISTIEDVEGERITIGKLSSIPSPEEILVGLCLEGGLGKVYTAFSIKFKKLNNSIISNATIGFKINKTWFLENNGTLEDIKLFRLNSTIKEWDVLSTSFEKEDDLFIYFRARTPGFSSFAVLFAKCECTPNIRRCFNNDVQVCVGNSTWIMVEKCGLGCKNGECIIPAPTSNLTEFFKLSLVITGISCGIVFVLFLIWTGIKRIIKKKRSGKINRKKKVKKVRK